MLPVPAIIGISVGAFLFLQLVVIPAFLYRWYPAVLVRGATRIIAQIAGFKSKRLNAGGFNWSYYESRSSSSVLQETIILIHGYGTNKESWASFGRYLVKRGYRVIAPDVPGNGYTLPLECESYEVTKQVDRLHAFVGEVMEGGKFHLGGLSMGGHIAGVYAATYPEQLQSLLLMCPAGAKGAKLSKLAEDVVVYGKPNPLLVEDSDSMRDLLGHVFYKLPWIPTGVLTYFVSEKVQRLDIDRQIVRDLEAGELGSGLAKVLKEIQAPTMLAWGDKDELIDPSCVPVIESGLPRKPFTVIMKDVGHALNAERPREIAEHYLEFLHKLHEGGGHRDAALQQTILDREAANDQPNKRIAAASTYVGNAAARGRVSADAHEVIMGGERPPQQRQQPPSVKSSPLHLGNFASMHDSIRPPVIVARPPSPSIVEVASDTPPSPVAGAAPPAGSPLAEPVWHEDTSRSSTGRDVDARPPFDTASTRFEASTTIPTTAIVSPPAYHWTEDKLTVADDITASKSKKALAGTTKVNRSASKKQHERRTKQVDRGEAVDRKHDSALTEEYDSEQQV